MCRVQLLGSVQEAARSCDGEVLFAVAAGVSGRECTVDVALSDAAPVVRGVSERAGSALSSLACSEDDAPDNSTEAVQVRPYATLTVKLLCSDLAVPLGVRIVQL